MIEFPYFEPEAHKNWHVSVNPTRFDVGRGEEEDRQAAF